MLNVLKNRFEQGCKTSPYPNATVKLPARYRGLPRINKQATASDVAACAEQCPQGAIDAEALTLDMATCTFCGT